MNSSPESASFDQSTNRGSSDSFGSIPLRAFVAAALFSAIWVIGFALRFSGYLVDDAYIGFQFVRNLAQGNGFVFYRGGNPVEGVTNIAWLLVLLPWGASERLPVAAQVLGASCAVLAIWCVLRICRMQPRDDNHGWPEVLAPAILLMFSVDFLYFSSAGMETGLASLATLLPALFFQPFRSASLHIGLFCAGITLIRPEMMLIFPGYVVLRTIFAEPGGTATADRRLWRAVVSWALLITAFAALRMYYFGMPLPNTYWAKPGSSYVFLGNLMMSSLGSHANLAFPFNLSLIFLVPTLLVGWRQLRARCPEQADWLTAVTFTGLFFAISAPLDWTKTGRYFAPYLGAGFVIAWEGTAAIVRASLQSIGRGSDVRVVLLLILELLVVTDVCDFGIRFSDDRLSQYPGYVLTSRPLIPAARWIAEHTEADAVIATRRIGALAYFSGRRVFDYLYGLTEPEIARKVHRRGGIPDGPQDPELKDIWQKVNPDYLLEDESVMRSIAAACNGSLERLAIHGSVYSLFKRFALGSENWVLMRRM